MWRERAPVCGTPRERRWWRALKYPPTTFTGTHDHRESRRQVLQGLPAVCGKRERWKDVNDRLRFSGQPPRPAPGTSRERRWWRALKYPPTTFTGTHDHRESRRQVLQGLPAVCGKRERWKDVNDRLRFSGQPPRPAPGTSRERRWWRALKYPPTTFTGTHDHRESRRQVLQGLPAVCGKRERWKDVNDRLRFSGQPPRPAPGTSRERRWWRALKYPPTTFTGTHDHRESRRQVLQGLPAVCGKRERWKDVNDRLRFSGQPPRPAPGTSRERRWWRALKYPPTTFTGTHDHRESRRQVLQGLPAVCGKREGWKDVNDRLRFSGQPPRPAPGTPRERRWWRALKYPPTTFTGTHDHRESRRQVLQGLPAVCGKRERWKDVNDRLRFSGQPPRPAPGTSRERRWWRALKNPPTPFTGTHERGESRRQE